MARKNYYLNIEDETILFAFIDLTEDGSIPDYHINKDNALSNDPEILDITHLNYTPAKLSVWNGTEFISPNGEPHRKACGEGCENGCITFAFLKDNIFYGSNGYCVGVHINDMIIAGLQSNPKITYEII